MIINWYQTVKGNSPKFAEFLEKFQFVQKGILEGIAYEQEKYNKEMEKMRADNYIRFCRNSPERKHHEELGVEDYLFRWGDLPALAEDINLWGGPLYDVFDVEFAKIDKAWMVYAQKEAARKTVAMELFPVIDAPEEFFECGYGENHPVIASIKNFVSRRTSEDQKINLKAFVDIWTIFLLGGDAAIEYRDKLEKATHRGSVKITDWEPAKTLEELHKIEKAFNTIDCSKFATYDDLFAAVKELE